MRYGSLKTTQGFEYVPYDYSDDLSKNKTRNLKRAFYKHM